MSRVPRVGAWKTQMANGLVVRPAPLAHASCVSSPLRWGGWGFWDWLGRSFVQICCKGPDRAEAQKEKR